MLPNCYSGLSTREAPTFALTNTTTGKTWEYDSLPQLRTAARLYAVQHPTDSLSVTINGATCEVR